MKKTVVLLMLSIFSVVALAQRPAVLVVPDKAPYQKGMAVRGKIKTECNLEVHMANDIASSARSVYDEIRREKPASGKYHILEVEIIGVWGAGGGAWSGPKNMEIRGVLRDQSGKKVGSYTVERHSMGGVLGGVKGTCGIMRRIAKVLARDTAGFLRSPGMEIRIED